MKLETFIVDDENLEVIENSQILVELEIERDVCNAIKEECVTDYRFKSDRGVFQIKHLHTNCGISQYKIIELNSHTRRNRKGKYVKVEMKKRNIDRLVSDIGIVNAQMIHAVDYHTYTYIPLRTYLKQHKQEFPTTEIYEKDFDDNYTVVRHKNLFSKYKDEVSDFERITTVERIDKKTLKVSYILDEDIFEYDDSKATLQERKFTREFAKDIYNKKNKYTERELFEILKGRDLYIRIINTVPKEHKDVWSKVKVDDMDIRELKQFRKQNVKPDRPEFKKRKYLSKKQKIKKKRRQDSRETATRVRDFEIYED